MKLKRSSKKEHAENVRLIVNEVTNGAVVAQLEAEKAQLKKALTESDGFKDKLKEENNELKKANQQLDDALKSAIAERNSRADAIYRVLQLGMSETVSQQGSNPDAEMRLACTMAVLLRP